MHDSYKRMMEFAKNHRPSGGLSNMYLIQTKDTDGNVTGEYYGMNMFTDLGMTEFFVNDASFPVNLYVGQGTQSFNKTTGSVLSEKIPDVTMAATNTNTDKVYSYPMYYYDPTRYGIYDEPGIITCIMKFLTCKFPTNITNVGADFAITEFGIGTGIDALWCHSWVYDVNGEKISVIKHINEELYITVYMCYSYYETLITDGYKAIVMDDGVMKKDPSLDPSEIGTPYPQFNVITTCQRFFNRMWAEGIYTYKRNNLIQSRGIASNTKSRFENSSITYTSNMSAFTMYSGSGNDSGYFDGFVQKYAGFHTVEPQQLEVAENVVLNDYMSSDAANLYGFSNKFGHKDYTPISQINVSNVLLFDHKSRAEDRIVNNVDFRNDSNKWYDETHMSTSFTQPIYYTSNDEVMPLYVHQNLRTDDPITKISTESATVYATDKYWDSSKWIWITDYSNIPVNARNCRYWLTSTNVAITPTRSIKPFHLVKYGTSLDGFSNALTGLTSPYGIYQTSSNADYNWWANGNNIYYNGTSNKYSFNVGSSSDDLQTHGYDKYVISFLSSSDFYITDMSDAEDGNHPRTTITPLFSTSTNIMTGCYRTTNDSGIFCLSSISGNEANIVDLRGVTYDQVLINAKIAACIHGTNLIAYIDPTDLSKVKIYDVDQRVTTVDEYTLTDGETNANFIIGLDDYIWVTNSSSYTYLIDRTNGTVTKLDSTTYLNFGSNLRYTKISAVDDTMVIYRYNEGNSSNARALYTENPTNIYNLSSFSPSVSGDLGMMNMSLQYVNQHDGHATLAMILVHRYRNSGSNNYGAHNQVSDFGRYLYNGTIKTYETTSDSYCGWIPYGEQLVVGTTTPKLGLIMNYLPIKIVGTTHTIGCLNNIKHISGKQYRVSFTNTPLFGTGPNDGKPPGIKN